MPDEPIQFDLDLESIQRLSPGKGLFDTLGLTVSYNFSSDALRSATPAGPSEIIKTVVHETTHLYQMLTTPYGYYYYALRAFQCNQALALIRLLQNDYGVKVKYPLARQIVQLQPRAKYKNLVDNLYLWYLAELLILYFEGNVDAFLDLAVRHPVFRGWSPLQMFAEMERFLIRFFGTIGRPVEEYAGPNLAFNDEAFQIEKMAIGMKAAGDLDMLALLESAAKVAEFWTEPPDGPVDFEKWLPVSMSAGQSKYYMLIHPVKGGIKAGNIREFVYTYAALCELALFAPLLPQHAALRPSKSTNIESLHPLLRMFKAAGVSGKLKPVSNLEQDYDRFMQELCGELQWLTPNEMNVRSMPKFRYVQEDRISSLYDTAQRYRHAMPGIFTDHRILFTFDQPAARQFSSTFTPLVIELTDKTLFHKDKNLIDYFLVQYVTQSYLRKVLLSNDLSVRLPHRAGAEELEMYRSVLATFLNLSAGLQNPPIVITGRDE